MIFNINLTERCNLNCTHCFALKRNLDMSSEVIDLTLEYLIDLINSSADEEHSVIFLGGEIGLLNPDIISSFMNKLNDSVDSIINYEISTNLVYEITDAHLNLFKMFDEITVSYDPNIRFKSKQQKKLWKDNVKLLKDNNILVNCVISVTKDVVNINPKIFFENLLNLDCNSYDLMTIAPSDSNILRWKMVKALNEKEDDWLYEVYLLYKGYQQANDKFIIYFFKGIEDLILHNETYEDFCRDCQTSRLTFGPDGMISQCPFTQSKPFYDLKSKTYYKENHEHWLNKEKEVNEKCYDCTLFKYCKGDCCLHLWDETGCACPKKIFNYIIDNKKALQ